MGKRNFKTGKGFGKRNNTSRDDTTDNRGKWTEVTRENEKWETYYKALGLIPEDEWDTFKKVCQSMLPLTFRVTGSKAHAKEVNQNFIDEHVSKLKDEEYEGIKLAPKNIAFYPDKLGWQLDVPKSVIRKNEEYAKTQRFLVLETTVGNISRQEAVSMIPPLLMDIEPHHSVLDMCAAPGSKTAQLVEALHANDAETPATGFVIANDSDYKRSHMLVHQVKRLSSPNFLVVNHDAQLFPRVRLEGSESFLKFDRVLCDVPCSGDGTMRKNINVWKDFTIADGMGLHPLQVNILTRGLQLLKDGGRLVYSTCSLSPIENEAVVAEALRKFDQVSLVDVSNELPGLKRRPGISSWKVFAKDLTEKFEPESNIHATAFPPSEEEAKRFNLDRCVRVYPHLQNTGGFFITVFEKKAKVTTKRSATASEEPELKKAKTEAKAKKEAPKAKKEEVSEEASEAPEDATEIPEDTADAPVNAVRMSKQKTPRGANDEPFTFLDPSNEQLQKCWKFYEVDDEFPRDTELVRNSTGEASRMIYYVSPSISDILKIQKQKLKLIHAGIKLFTAQRNDNGLCRWRVQHESLDLIRRHLGPARQLSTNMEMLKILFTEAFPKITRLQESGLDPEFASRLETLDEGCLFLTVERENCEDLFLALWKGKTNVNLMVNKFESQELLLRLYGIQTSVNDEGKEKIYQDRVEAEKSARASKENFEVPAEDSEAPEKSE